MISVSIYGDNYRDSHWLDDHQLSGSFIVVLIAFFLYSVVAVILLVTECQGMFDYLKYMHKCLIPSIFLRNSL